eukprot:Hpha_TRINITY_DN15757_c2_g14::TRINITY_DN15757_c2_g14_i1::g.37630::m.37630/K14780/DHX37, DHR1; ATP-dependent RNA helicase DHX37/DHR1
MNPQLQKRVFEAVPPGKRLCVVATNVAETSLTLPGIRYVVDCGRAKVKRYDAATGVARFEVDWINKASAEQRAGRAGRLGPGHSYRLFSTAVYANHMADHAAPEILESPLESLVLFIKGFWDRSVLAFPFPTPPPRSGVESSLVHLARIGALTDDRRKGQYKICPFGREISKLPLLPRYGKMIVIAKALQNTSPSPEQQQWLRGFQRPVLPSGARSRLLSSVVSVVAIASSLLDVFLPPGTDDPEEMQRFRQTVRKYRHPGSDYLTALRVLFDYIKSGGGASKFCNENFLVFRGMKDAVGLRKQLSQLLASEEESADVYGVLADEEEVTEKTSSAARHKMLSLLGKASTPRCEEEEVMVRKIIASGLVDQVARRAAPHECELRKPPIKFDDSSGRRAAYIQPLTGEVMFIHPLSAVATVSPPPDYVVYTGLTMQRNKRKRPKDGEEAPAGKVLMKGVTAVKKEWLRDLGWEDTG